MQEPKYRSTALNPEDRLPRGHVFKIVRGGRFLAPSLFPLRVQLIRQEKRMGKWAPYVKDIVVDDYSCDANPADIRGAMNYLLYTKEMKEYCAAQSDPVPALLGYYPPKSII